ncbi:MAG: hypothetical protein Q8J64_07720 [Thermodesulfovibrionales bacterium]|nr:hypothetical protein [Thermodesulfovibrionales bacterium]
MVFDRAKLRIKPLGERTHDISLSCIMELAPHGSPHASLREVASRIKAAKAGGSGIIMMMGGHVIRACVQRYIIDLMERGYVTCLSMNGSCVIHDYEFALIGATTESVARYIKEGEFGLWKETGSINDIVNEAYSRGGVGMGEAVGKAICEGDFPHKDISLLAACHRLKIPATVHVGIGFDIIHEHPNFDGAAAGATSYFDFLRFTDAVSRLEGGVVMNFGSAVTAPEVYLKALSMARNVAAQEGRHIRRFTTLVCDLHELPGDFRKEPAKECPAYYFRPWKTMLVRTVADGGESFYVRGTHSQTIPALWTAVRGF